MSFSFYIFVYIFVILLLPISIWVYQSTDANWVMCFKCGDGGHWHVKCGGHDCVNSGAVVCEKGVEEGAEDASLWRSCVQDQSWGCGAAYPDVLLRKSDIQKHSELLKPKSLCFWISLYGSIVLIAELKSTNSILTYVFWSSRCVCAEWRAVGTALSVHLLVWYSNWCLSRSAGVAAFIFIH